MGLVFTLRHLFFLVISLCLLSCVNHEKRYVDDAGQSYTLSELKGKWVLINYWAPWCDTCLKEIAVLNTLVKQTNNHFVLLSIVMDHPSVNELRQVKNKLHIHYPVLLDDPGSEWHLHSVEGLPTSFILNPEGKLVKEILGQVSEQVIKSIISS